MKPHILFVDDEADIREMVTLYFREHGYEIATATTSAEAMKLASATAYQLAILDVNLAGENGLELLATLRAAHPKLPIIIFTGFETNEDLVARALAQGADGYMRKTDSLEHLLGSVQQFAPTGKTVG